MQAEFVNAIETRFFGKSSILENKIYVVATLLDPRLVISMNVYYADLDSRA